MPCSALLIQQISHQPRIERLVDAFGRLVDAFGRLGRHQQFLLQHWLGGFSEAKARVSSVEFAWCVLSDAQSMHLRGWPSVFE